jgi:hypothetical protein
MSDEGDGSPQPDPRVLNGAQGGTGEQLALQMLMDTVMDTERIRAEQQAAVQRLIQIQVQLRPGMSNVPEWLADTVSVAWQTHISQHSADAELVRAEQAAAVQRLIQLQPEGLNRRFPQDTGNGSTRTSWLSSSNRAPSLLYRNLKLQSPATSAKVLPPLSQPQSSSIPPESRSQAMQDAMMRDAEASRNPDAPGTPTPDLRDVELDAAAQSASTCQEPLRPSTDWAKLLLMLRLSLRRRKTIHMMKT